MNPKEEPRRLSELQLIEVVDELCSSPGSNWRHIGLFFEEKHRFKISYELLKAYAPQATPDRDLCRNLIANLMERGVTIEEFVTVLEDRRIGLNALASDLRKRFGLKLAHFSDPNSLTSKPFYFEVTNDLTLQIAGNDTIEELDALLQQKRQVIINNEISASGTTLANEFCRKAKGYTYVLWLDGADDTRLLASFLRLADWFKIPIPDVSSLDIFAASYLKQIFDRLGERPTLWVFDSCTSVNAMQRFFPTRSEAYHVILTVKSIPAVEKDLVDIWPKPDLKSFDEKCLLFVRMIAMLDKPEFPAAILFNTDVFVPLASTTKESDLQKLLQPLTERQFVSFTTAKNRTMIQVNEQYHQFCKSVALPEALEKWIDVLASTNSSFNDWTFNQAKANIFAAISPYASKSTQEAPRYLNTVAQFLGFWNATYKFPPDFFVNSAFNTIDPNTVALIKALCVIEQDPHFDPFPKQSNTTNQLLERYCHARQILYSCNFDDAYNVLKKCNDSAVTMLGPCHPFTLKLVYWLIRTLLSKRQLRVAKEMLEEKVYDSHTILDFIFLKFHKQLEDPTVTKWMICVADTLLYCGELEESYKIYKESLKHQLTFDVLFDNYLIRTLVGLLCYEMEVRLTNAARQSEIISNGAISWEDVMLHVKSTLVEEKFKDFSISPYYYHLIALCNQYPYRIPPRSDPIIRHQLHLKDQFMEVTLYNQSLVMWKEGPQYSVIYTHALSNLDNNCLKFLQRLALVTLAPPPVLLNSIFNQKCNPRKYDRLTDLFKQNFLSNKENPIIQLKINMYIPLLRSTMNVEDAVRWWTKKLKAAITCKASNDHYLQQSVIFHDLSDIVRNIMNDEVAMEFWTTLLEFLVICKEVPAIRDINNFKHTAIKNRFPVHSRLIEGVCLRSIGKWKEAVECFTGQVTLQSQNFPDKQKLLQLSQFLLARSLSEPDDKDNPNLTKAKKLFENCVDTCIHFKYTRLQCLGLCLTKLGQFEEAKTVLLQCYNEWTNGTDMHNYSLLAETTFYLAQCEKQTASANASQLFTQSLILQLRHDVQMHFRMITAELILVSRQPNKSELAPIVLLHSENEDQVNIENFEALYEEKLLTASFQYATGCQFVYYTPATRGKFCSLVQVRYNNQTLVVYYESANNFAIAIVNSSL